MEIFNTVLSINYCTVVSEYTFSDVQRNGAWGSEFANQPNLKLPGVLGLVWSQNSCHSIMCSSGLSPVAAQVKGISGSFPWVREVAMEWDYLILWQCLGCCWIKNIHIRLYVWAQRFWRRWALTVPPSSYPTASPGMPPPNLPPSLSLVQVTTK